MEGKFVSDFAVLFKPQDKSSYGFKSLQKCYKHLQQNWDVGMDPISKETMSIFADYSEKSWFEINWTESTESKHALAKGEVWTLSVMFKRDEYIINSYRELDSILAKKGVKRKG